MKHAPRPGRRARTYLDAGRRVSFVTWGAPRPFGRWDTWGLAASAGAYQMNCFRRLPDFKDRLAWAPDGSREHRDARLAAAIDELVSGDIAYAFCNNSAQLIKIGRTTNLRRRWAKLENESGDLRQLLCVWRCPDSRALERELHARWIDHRSFGEWFAAPPLLDDLQQVYRTRIAAGADGDGRAG